MYRCEKCGKLTTLEELLGKSEGKFKCPECQFKILTKIRPRVVKRVKAI
jgi:DNA-directed RNA polymerase subunit RPC12/RpoP